MTSSTAMLSPRPQSSWSTSGKSTHPPYHRPNNDRISQRTGKYYMIRNLTATPSHSNQSASLLHLLMRPSPILATSSLALVAGTFSVYHLRSCSQLTTSSFLSLYSVSCTLESVRVSISFPCLAPSTYVRLTVSRAGSKVANLLSFLAMAKILAVFNISKPVDANGNPIDPVIDYNDGTIRYVFVFCVARYNTDPRTVWVSFILVTLRRSSA